MGQTAGVIVSKTMNLEKSGGLVYFMAMDGVKFRKLVEPGDVLRMKVSKEKSRGNVWRFRGEAYVEDVLVAEASFMAMIVLEDKNK
jgi:3-hydroxyacyl-[acyl-carrier-protein] dehydratase